MELVELGDFKDRFPEGIQQLAQWVKNGKLKGTEGIAGFI